MRSSREWQSALTSAYDSRELLSGFATDFQFHPPPSAKPVTFIPEAARRRVLHQPDRAKPVADRGVIAGVPTSGMRTAGYRTIEKLTASGNHPAPENERCLTTI